MPANLPSIAGRKRFPAMTSRNLSNGFPTSRHAAMSSSSYGINKSIKACTKFKNEEATLSLIGVTADSDDSPEREPRFFLLRRYLHPLTESGATALILPPIARTAVVRKTLSILDGLVITGGNFDIHPSYYGEKPIAQLGAMKNRRTEFELEIADAALRKDLPLLGLCGGE